VSGPAPPVAAVRRVVRRALSDLPAGAVVLVAVSGGPDSMSLAAAAAFESRRTAWRCAAVVVDHQLQPESSAVADRTASGLRRLGLDPVLVRTVDVGAAGGPEAAARAARYAAIDAVADDLGATVVLLGHTKDDQAESVLLGLARGSGSRSIRGMAPVRGRYRRPLLTVDRATTRAACEAERLDVWHDPHNSDPAFARVRVRDAMDVLERAIGPGVSDALARTASALADDDDALEQWAREVRSRARAVDDAGRPALTVEVIASVPAAVRRRALRAEALATGVPGGSLRASHLADVDALVARWSGQGPVHLPSGVRAWRDCGRLVLAQMDAQLGEAPEP
jgi:tRNA(Ile)-lysidine synthase